MNRDTLKCAVKLCQRIDMSGTVHPIMKAPKTDAGKGSLPGDMQVNIVDGIPMVYPSISTWEDCRVNDDLLKTVWNCGPVPYVFETFSESRIRFADGWGKRPPVADVISTQMKAKYDHVLASIRDGHVEGLRA